LNKYNWFLFLNFTSKDHQILRSYEKDFIFNVIGITWVDLLKMNLVQNLSLLHQKQYSKIKKAIPPTADIPPIKTPNVFKTQSFWIQIRVLHNNSWE
jgi:hypothetical protein